MPLQRALALSEIRSALTIIWTQVVDSILYDDNRYARSVERETGSSKMWTRFWYSIFRVITITLHDTITGLKKKRKKKTLIRTVLQLLPRALDKVPS